MRKLIPLLFFALGSLLLAPRSPGAELTDLGQGLSYLRVHSVADSEAVLRKAAPAAGALVLDLRYATADETSAAIVKTALTGRTAPTFVLVSPATAPALAPVIAGSPALTLGAPGSTPPPKVTVHIDAPADRKAFDALDAGTELSQLITGKIEKERYDEATLVQEFKNGNQDPAPPPAAPLPADRAGQTPAATTLPPAGGKESAAPVDRVLQRAVHLHRALQALRR